MWGFGRREQLLFSRHFGPAWGDKADIMTLSIKTICDIMQLPSGSVGKEYACNAGTAGDSQVRSQGREDPLEKGMATHSQYSCLENPMDRGAWQATVHGVAMSQTWHVIPRGKKGSLEEESTVNWTHQGGLPGGGGTELDNPWWLSQHTLFWAPC